MSTLFEPYTLRALTIPNRVWMAPMCQYSAAPDGPEAGAPNDWHFAHYAARATGGTGLIVVEATAVSPEGRISPYDLGIWNDTQVEAFRRITRFLAAQGTVPAVQLAHAGRKAATDQPWKGGAPLGPDERAWQPVAPSAVPFAEDHQVPDELSTEEIREIVGQFRAAARRALAAGFEIAEIHGAHGYLINEFLSPHSNHRTDAYGGSYDNCTRFAFEVVDAVREEWPDDKPLFFRVSATDWLDADGWTPDDTVRLAADLHARGVDLL
ncbi:NADH:flavin oxidoreductase/NADH oxidase, partial [Streptomyces griseoincarnatus]